LRKRQQENDKIQKRKKDFGEPSKGVLQRKACNTGANIRGKITSKHLEIRKGKERKVKNYKKGNEQNLTNGGHRVYDQRKLGDRGKIKKDLTVAQTSVW